MFRLTECVMEPCKSSYQMASETVEQLKQGDRPRCREMYLNGWSHLHCKSDFAQNQPITADAKIPGKRPHLLFSEFSA